MYREATVCELAIVNLHMYDFQLLLLPQKLSNIKIDCKYFHIFWAIVLEHGCFILLICPLD